MYMLFRYKYISVFQRKWGPKLREIVLFLFRKQNSFNNWRKDGKFGIDLVDAMPNTLQALEIANVSRLLSSTWKHCHIQWRPSIIQWCMYEAIVKSVIQGTPCFKDGFNPICIQFHIFPKIIKGVLFPERSKYHFSQV